MINFCAILLVPEVAPIVIVEHFGHEVELRGQLTHVSEVCHCVGEGLVKGGEDALRVVQCPSMQFDVGFNIRCNSRQIVENDSRVREVRAAVEAIIQTDEAFCILVFALEFSLSLRCAKELHILGQVSELAWWGTTSRLLLKRGEIW